MEERTPQTFGTRLARFRQQRGLTQAELGRLIGISQRMVAYYETESLQPPGALLADLVRVLRVPADELLGLGPAVEQLSPKLARFRKRLLKAEALPAEDQRAVLRLIDTLYKAHQRTQGSRPARRPQPRRTE